MITQQTGQSRTSLLWAGAELLELRYSRSTAPAVSLACVCRRRRMVNRCNLTFHKGETRKLAHLVLPESLLRPPSAKFTTWYSGVLLILLVHRVHQGTRTYTFFRCDRTGLRIRLAVCSPKLTQIANEMETLNRFPYIPGTDYVVYIRVFTWYFEVDDFSSSSYT